MKVKFLSESQIEKAAMQLLAGYSAKFGPISAPIPVDEVLECYLGLNLDFKDLSVYGDDVLGATWPREKRVAVDQSLDPSVFPHKLGRYRFTVAHEIGHLELHAHQLRDGEQPALFGKTEGPAIVCRSGSKKEPIEWQADQYAAHLLMPADMVYPVWREVYGDKPYVAIDEIAELSQRADATEFTTPTVSVARKMAKRFEVSGQAMQIRLESLRLIRMEPAEPELF